MTASPTIGIVEYAPGSLSVIWYPDGATSFVLTLSDQTAGTSTTYNVTGSSTKITITLSATSSYAVQIAAVEGGQTGTASAAVPVITNSPIITRAANMTSSVDLTWQPPAGYTGEFIAVLQTKGKSSSSSDPITAYSYSFPQSSPVTGTSTIIGVQSQKQVNGATTTGPLVSYTVITATAAITKVDFSNSINLVLTWTSSDATGSFTAFLTNVAGGTTSQTVSAQTACSFAGIVTSAQYTVNVCASSADGVSLGPSSILYNAIVTAPTLTGVLTTGTGLELDWLALSGADGYVCYAQVTGQAQTSAAVSGTSYVFTSLNPVTAGTTTWMRATGGGGVVIGPQTSVYTALVGQPLWILVANDGQTLSLSWNAPTDTTGVAGYLITIGGLTPPTYQTGSTATSTSITASLTPGGSYPTTVAATNGIVRGLPSPTLLPLTKTPAGTVFGYTGSALRLSWSPTGEYGVTGYIAALAANGVTIDTQTPTTSPQTFAAVFAANTAYTARVRASGAGTQGPWSNWNTGPYQTAVTYVADCQARLLSEAWQSAATVSYAMDAAGNITSVTPQAPPAAEGTGS